MSRLQNRLYGPDLSSFSTNSYGYWLLNEPKSGLKHSIFRFGPNSPTAFWTLQMWSLAVFSRRTDADLD